ncbi:MAG TPA: SRPBCC family protein [Anaerolineales bacterium]|nr:SRPBCC family protein [Anaerolineales bacterium]
MKSMVEVEINKSQGESAELYADPRNNLKWMHDIARYEPLSGKEGMPGSTYRLVPKEGDMIFLATVVERNLPDELKLHLEGSDADVDVKGTFRSLSPTRTKLISEEVFTFKGGGDETLSPSVKEDIQAAHRRHIEDFKSFAENQ